MEKTRETGANRWHEHDDDKKRGGVCVRCVFFPPKFCLWTKRLRAFCPLIGWLTFCCWCSREQPERGDVKLHWDDVFWFSGPQTYSLDRPTLYTWTFSTLWAPSTKLISCLGGGDCLHRQMTSSLAAVCLQFPACTDRFPSRTDTNKETNTHAYTHRLAVLR